MQKRYTYVLLILFAFLLIISIIFTQTFTNRANYALQKGNVEAVETFKNNNAMQQLVNFSFALQSRFVNAKSFIKADSTLVDSLTLFGYNSSILNDAILKKGKVPNLKELTNAVNSQLNISYAIWNAYQDRAPTILTKLADSLQKKKPADDVYKYGVLVQKYLEHQFQNTLITNSAHATKLSSYIHTLSICAIFAVLIFTTLIIIRQLQQVILIKELELAREAAIKSRNAKDEFLANMSHELRTPLNSLIGFGNLLTETQLDEKQKEYTDIIVSNGQSLLQIVNDILDFSFIEAGKLRIKHVEFNLNDLMENVARMFSSLVRKKKLSYQWTMDADVPHVLIGDPKRIKQVLINLINNAIKFTAEGGIFINIKSDPRSSPDKPVLLFSIRDTGIGIPEDKKQIIFERFEQLEHSATRQYGGTGLGLSIVKKLVESMGGTINVISEIGSGSEFRFTCTFDGQPVDVKNALQEHDNNCIDFKNLHILVVEDNPANSKLVTHLLDKYGISVSLAADGVQAVQMINKNLRHDLILMDIQMPNMDGYQAIHVIRNEMKSDIPAIAMTAYVMENEVQRCYTAGFNDYIAKPIQEMELVKKLSKFITPSALPVNPEQNGIAGFDFFQELMGNDNHAMKEVVTEVKKQWKLDKNDLNQSSVNGDTDEFNRIIHRIKSTFSLLGPDSEVQKILKKDSVSSLDKDSLIKKSDWIIQSIDRIASQIFEKI